MVRATGIAINSHSLDERSRICLRPSVLSAHLHEPPVADPHGRWCGREGLNALLDTISWLRTRSVIRLVRLLVSLKVFRNLEPDLYLQIFVVPESTQKLRVKTLVAGSDLYEKYPHGVLKD